MLVFPLGIARPFRGLTAQRRRAVVTVDNPTPKTTWRAVGTQQLTRLQLRTYGTPGERGTYLCYRNDGPATLRCLAPKGAN